MLDRIHWLGHASFRLNGPPHAEGPVIYIDPWRLPADSPAADIILISHDHHDHLSPPDIEHVQTENTVIITNSRVAEVLQGDVRVIRPWQGAINVGDVCVRAVPAYTISSSYHDISYEGLGFLISLMRYDIYFAGDTELIPEMSKIGCDIALLPVGGRFTMTAEEAASAADMIRPQYAIPMHYGREIPGSFEDGQRFCRLVSPGITALEQVPESIATFSHGS